MPRAPRREAAADQQRGRPVSNKIFVGGLSQSTTKESLNQHFAQFGPADAVVMIDKVTGRSRGFGFCTFASPEAAQQALEARAQVVDGKAVECAPCFSKPPLDQQLRGSGGGGGGEAPRAENKIFVGALSQDTTTEKLQAYFSQYGQCEAVVMMDKATGRSRGFGFCTFASGDSMVAALRSQHAIDGKTVDCKVCSPKGEVQMPYKPNKLFVGGLPQSADESKLRGFFSQFGSVADARVMTDKESGKSRGFGYVTFESPQSCELVLANHTANVIDHKWVEVKRCTERMALAGGKGTQALAHLTPQQLAQVASLTQQLQSILSQPVMQSLQAQMAGCGKGGGGKGSQKGGGAHHPATR